MADFEEQDSAAAKPAPVNGLSDDATIFDDRSLEASHYAKHSDSHLQHFDSFPTQPSSTMADYSVPSDVHGHAGYYQDEADFPPSNEARDFGRYHDDQEEDLPANFAKEAAKNQRFTESNFDDEPSDVDASVSRRDEVEEVTQQDYSSNPFETDTSKQLSGSYVDNSDRPIMGYNPFLNDEKDSDRQGDVSDEEMDHDQEEQFGEDAEVEQDEESEVRPVRNIPESEDDADLHVESVEEGVHEEEGVGPADDFEEGHVDDDRASEHQKYGYDSQEYPDSRPPRTDLEELGIYEDYQRDDLENIPPQTKGNEDDDLGIVNQGFSDDGDAEGGKIISEEEEIVESEAPYTEASQRVNARFYEDDQKEETEQPTRHEEFYEEDRKQEIEQPTRHEDLYEEDQKQVTEQPTRYDEFYEEDRKQETEQPTRYDELYEEDQKQETEQPTRYDELYEEDRKQETEQPTRYDELYEEDRKQETEQPTRHDELYEEDQKQVTEQPTKKEEEMEEYEDELEIDEHSRSLDDREESSRDIEIDEDERYEEKRGVEEQTRHEVEEKYTKDEYMKEDQSPDREEIEDVRRKEDYLQEDQSPDREETEDIGRKEDYLQEDQSPDREEIEDVGRKEVYVHEEFRHEEKESEPVDTEREYRQEVDFDTHGDDTREKYTPSHGDFENAGVLDEKGYISRIQDSDLLSSENDDRSFVDNLSDVASPETIPQPLPSPPEPKNVSPQASPCQEPEVNLGQHGTPPDQNYTPEFLTVGEVEGETKFGVDGTAITSTASQNNAFLHSDDEDEEEDEEEEESQNLEQEAATATATTTETETSVDEKSADYAGQGYEQMEANDSALMSMSMEGSFYDDGGELIGGEDKRNQQENHLYEGESIIEERSQHESFEPKQDSLLVNTDELGQVVQADVAVEKESYERSQDIFDIRDNEDYLEEERADTAQPESLVNFESQQESKAVDLGSILDAPVPQQDQQLLVTAQEEFGESSVDNVGPDFAANESESSVDSQQAPPQEVQSPKDVAGTVEDVQIVDTATASPEKPEEPASSVEEPPAAPKEEPSSTAAEAAAATAAGVAVAAAAAAAATTKTTTTVKKTSAKAGGKTTTTTTTTKVTKETKTTNGKAATTKKSETATTAATSKTTPRKPTDSRPTSAATAERKTSAKATTSPTKPTVAAPSPAKTTATAAAHAPPSATRKPREVKTPSTEERKKPLTATTTATTTTTPRTTSATPRTPRPQSATTTPSSTSMTTTTKTTTRTSTTTSRTVPLARPKSSPTKLTNGTAASPADSKTPTKKHGADSKTEGSKPGIGKTATEKKESRTPSKVDTGSKAATPGSASRSPTKTTTTTTRTTATSKAGEIRSKIGSLDNATHTPGGGTVKITSKKPDFTNVTSKVGSKDKIDHKPGGGNVKIETKKVKVEAKSKVGSLDNAAHKPGGGDKKAESQKTSKTGSIDKQGPGSGSEQGAVEVHNGAASEN